MEQEQPTKQRLHITFGKFDALKYTSNLDIAKIWERVLRRAGLPILYTQGFNTRPRLQLATALPLGITSECEILDVALREVISLDGVIERILSVSPSGLKVYNIQEALIESSPLQTLVRSAEYRVRFLDEFNPNVLQQKIDTLMSQERIVKIHIRKNKKHVTDLRPMILGLALDKDNRLIAHLVTGNQGNVRIEDVMEELGMQNLHYNVHRYKLHVEAYR